MLYQLPTSAFSSSHSSLFGGYGSLCLYFSSTLPSTFLFHSFTMRLLDDEPFLPHSCQLVDDDAQEAYLIVTC